DLAAAHAARGLLLQWVDFDWTGAEAEYRRALELAPDGGARVPLGRMLGTLGHPQQAIAMYRQALATDPRRSGTWNWLGWYLASVGQFDEAEQAARKAVGLAPGSSFISSGLMLIQIQHGQTAAALATAQQMPADIWRDIALAFALQVGDDRAAADAALKSLIEKSADGS